MKTFGPPRFLFILALATLPASGQGFAPASVPVSSIVSWESTVSETYSEESGGFDRVYDEAYSMSITSANTFASPPYTTGTFTYTKTGPNTATLAYVSFTDEGPSFMENEQGTILLTFTSETEGTFTNSGSFTFYPLNLTGAFTSVGIFIYEPTLVFASPPVADDFNDNTKDPAKWGSDIEYTPGGTLTESGQRLNYSSEGYLERPWILNPPRYDQDWQVVLDLAGTFGSSAQTTYSGASMGIDISIPGNPNDFVFFVLEGYDNGTSIDWGVTGYSSEDDVYLPYSQLDGGQTCLRVSFDSSTKVLTCYYDPDGPQNGYSWLRLASFGINGSGGTDGNGSWGLSGSQPFQIAMLGYSDNRTITQGTLYADNFRIAAQAAAPDTPLRAWQRHYFGSPDSPDAALNFDKDKDGLTNLVEYACNLNPTIPGRSILTGGSGTSGLPLIQKIGTGPSARLKMEYVRRKDSSLSGIVYEPQFSGGMAATGPDAWQPASSTEAKVTIDTIWERVTVEDHAPAGLSRRFGRLKTVSSP